MSKSENLQSAPPDYYALYDTAIKRVATCRQEMFDFASISSANLAQLRYLVNQYRNSLDLAKAACDAWFAYTAHGGR